MWKRIIPIISLIFFPIFLSAGNSHLPKADLIRGSGPAVYVLSNGTRHWVPDPLTFNSFRYDWRNIKTVSDAELESHPKGDEISKYDDYPDGSLLRGSGPRVYLIELNRKRWIPSPSVFTGNNFGWQYIIEVDDDVLGDYETGDNLTLSESNRYPETVILESPEQAGLVENSEVFFRFSGTNPLGAAKDLTFEIYLAGQDSDWRTTNSGEKTYRLSGESRTYTFFVRAKNKQGYLDPTPASFTFSVGLSPYYGKVEIDDLRQDDENFKNDYLVLEHRDSQGGVIDVTGWKIQTKDADFIIPQAIKKLKPPFSADNYSDIELSYRDEVVISLNASPNGVNFQTNQCAGYLAQSYEFCPDLDEDCPRLDDSDYNHLKKACRDFIGDLDRCETADYAGDLSVSADSECTDFLIDHFSYSSCYDNHYREKDFFQGEWRVFLGKSSDIFDDETGAVILRDRNGRLVDRYDY